MNQLLTAVLVCSFFQFGMADVHAGEKIHSFAPDSFSQIVSSHRGKPSVVMVWALDCAYCDESFHALAQAQHRYKFSLVTIATDRVDDVEARRLIRKKLDASGLHSKLWAFGAAPEEQLRYAIDPIWRGELPRSYWFNADGKPVAYSGIITAGTVARLLPK